MRLAILADIHANLPALEAVIADAEQRGVDRFVVAGDLMGGPHPNETVHLLVSRGSVMIRGNSDDYALRLDAGQAPQAWQESKQWAYTRGTTRLINRTTFDCIKGLPDQFSLTLPRTAPIRVAHGSPRDPIERVVPDEDPGQLDELLALIEEPVMICGHTHLSWVHARDDQLAANPGSVGAPLDGDPRAKYLLLDWQDDRWQPQPRAVEYDYGRAAAAWECCGLMEEAGALARAAVLAILTGHDVFMDFLDYAHRLAREAGYGECEVVPDSVFDEASATFQWEAARCTKWLSPPEPSKTH